MAVIALDLGGTKLAAAVLTTRGQLRHRLTTLLDGRGGNRVGDLVCEAFLQCLDFARRNRISITGVGVAVPGISSPSGRIWAPNIPRWKDYPLGSRLRSIACRHKIPVAIDNDRACYILGEAWVGAARNCRNAVFFSVGTGIAAGLMVDGNIVRGAHGTAGSIGWMALDRPFRHEYKACGCFEFHASGEGLARLAQQLSPSRGSDRKNTATLLAASERNHPATKKIIADAVSFWGMGVANLVSAFDPEIIVFGGGVFGPARALIKAIRAEAVRWAQPVAMRKVRFCASKLGSDAGILGAGYLALRLRSNEIASGGRV